MIKGHWNRLAWVACLAFVGAVAAVSAQTAPARGTGTDASKAAQRLRVTVKTPGGVHVILPLGRKGKEIFYRLEGASAGQLALNVDTVESADFDLKYDTEQLQKAVRNMNWDQAANILLPVIQPTLYYFDLKDNDAASLALDAGMYLMKAAAVKTAGGLSGAAKERGTNEYAKAYGVLKTVARQGWFTGAESAHLRCVLCLFFLGKNEEAQQELEAARTPDLGDAAYGLYWIATAYLHLSSGNHAQAIEEAARSLVFETKDLDTFPEALLLSARCYEELLEWHRARDVYYEVGRLFGGTHWRGFATNRLDYVLAQGLTKSGDVSRVESVFFGSDEDLNAKSEKLLTALRENKEFTDSPKRTAGDPKRKTPEKKESAKDVKESKKEGAKSE